MPDLIRVEYGQTGASTRTNELGMRPMQQRVFGARTSQYLLIKAPPASGKSRALMFLALDKLSNQGIHKAIVAVPEMAIGGSFRDESLSESGFFADWVVRPEHNLCTPGSDQSKVGAFTEFMNNDAAELADRILVCTHATLRYAFAQLDPTAFNDCLLAIDEFHHVSADEGNKLGALIDSLMNDSSVHIVAMTGSYFRGDTVPILLPEDEARFDKVTFTYYEQLNGYRHLKSLGIGYHFYQGRYIDALPEVLDPNKKTIIHIPNVNSGESTKDKYTEVDYILDVLGTVVKEEPETYILHVRTEDGRVLKVANLVNEDPKRRPAVVHYLRHARDRDAVDIIVALGMAKEGFDWPWCEHVLTIGYRQSMTEVVQIIGRATRDAPGKSHAQFTNLIAQPTADDEDVKQAVNNMLKAITVSLLMEQVLAPTFQFKPRQPGGGLVTSGSITVGDGAKPPSKRVTDILNGSTEAITAALLQAPGVAESMMGGGVEPEVISQVELPKVIQTQFPDLSEEETEQIREGVMTQLAINASGGLFSEEDLPEGAEFIDGEGNPVDPPKPAPGTPDDEGDSQEPSGSRKFLKLSDKFINIEHLNIDLIDRVNPFRGAYEILSKSVTVPVLKTIQDEVASRRIQMSEEEALILWPKVKAFVETHKHEPSISSNDPSEQRLAEAVLYLRRKKREMQGARNATVG